MIDSAVVSQVYLGDGVATQFPIPFPFSDADHVKVSIYDTETETEMQLESDYYVDATASKLLYPGYPPGEEPPESEQPGPLPVGKKLVIYRETPINQLEDLGEKYPLPIVEGMVDKNTMILQEIAETTTRAVIIERGSEYTPKDVSSDIKNLKEYRDDAANSASAAAASATDAANSASAAATSETNAAASELAAAASAAAALASENAAKLSETKAATSEANALVSQNAAAGSAANAAASETNAATSAAESATDAGTATAAAAIVNTALPQILTAAASAGTSATAAQASATAAALSAGTATTQAELASGYATSAAGDAAAAADSASDAADSAAAAAESASEAEEANTEAKYYAKITMDKVAESAVGYPHQEGTLTYDGTEQTPTWDVFYEANKMTVTGTASATDAGTYTITMTPKPTYYWWDTDTTTARTQTWTIGRQAIEDVPSQDGTLTYDGTEQSPTWADYDSTKMTIGGTTAATNAGTYTATFTPTANYKWSDGTTTAKSVTWTIDAQAVTVPTVTDTSKTYNGAAQSPTISAYDSNIIQVSGDSATNAGSYAVVFHLVSATNYMWSDTTTADKSVSWTIAAKSVTVPTVTNTSLTYNGSAQSPTISTYDPAEVAVSGTATATNAGSYTVTLSLTSTSNYVWADSTTAAKSTNWSIYAAILAVPTLSNTSKMYNGSAQSPTISAYDATEITQTGTASATNAGTYTITFSLRDENTIWSDNTTADKTASWSISAKSVTPPTLSNTSKMYNGSAQSPTISAFSATEITQTGTASATNAGTYTITWSLTSTTNYVWSDSTTAAKSGTWSIAKAAGSSSLSKNSVSLTESKLTDTVTVTRSGDGAISATSSNTSIATVSVSGTTVTVTAVADGFATITVYVASGTNYTTPADKTISVSVDLVKAVLNQNSWATISRIAQAGTGDTYWDVGDVKMITLNGNIGDGFQASNLNLGVFILDFNHVDNGVSDNNIIFGGFETEVIRGVDVALSDSYYGTNRNDGTKSFSFSHRNNVNYGGWKASELRYDILGATSTAPTEYGQNKTLANVGYDATQSTIDTPLANTMMAALPNDFRNVLRLRTHYTDNVGNKSNTDAKISSVVDAVALLTEFEIFGKRTHANYYENAHQSRMMYYAYGNSRIKKFYKATDTLIAWIEASTNYESQTGICAVDGNGASDTRACFMSLGIAPVFKV